MGETYRSKALTIEEIELLKSSGMKVFPIYQDGGNKLSYFQRYHQGYYDAVTAIEAAKKLGFYTGTYIYFAVDFDCMEYEANEYIIPYFEQIFGVFNSTETNSKNYKVGIYAPRLICSMVENAGYALRSFVADMSTGYSGNLGYPLPENCAFDQFAKITFTSTPNFAIDKLGYSGYDPGCSHFDEVVEETLKEKIESARQDYARKFMKSTNCLGKNVTFSLNTEGTTKVDLGTYFNGNNSVHLEVVFGTELSTNDDATLINISFDQNGKLSQSFLDTLTLNISEMIDENTKSTIDQMVQDMAVSAGFGVISINVSFNPEIPTYYKVEYTLYTDDVLPELETNAEFYCKQIAEFNIIENYPDDQMPSEGFNPVLTTSEYTFERNSLGFTGLLSVMSFIDELSFTTAVALSLEAIVFIIVIRLISKLVFGV